MRWLQPLATSHPGYSTVWNHLKKYWYIASTTAFKEQSESAFHFESDGGAVLMKDGAGVFHKVALTDLTRCGMAMAQAAVTAVRSALPQSCKELYDTFDYRRLTDNLACWDSLFYQPPNAAYLEPMCNKLEMAIMEQLTNRNGHLNAKKALKWVEKEQKILKACLGNFVLFSPIPPRDFQVKGFYLHGSEIDARPRNLIILDGRICLANPPMKGQRGKRLRAEALWAMSAMISNPFAFSTGVLRPVVTKVLVKLQRNTSLREKHVFVHSIAQGRKKNPEVFTGSDVNKTLQAFTRELPIKLSVRLLRHFSAVMFEEHYPEMVQAVARTGDSTVDKLGQHKRSTAHTHYSHVQTQSSQLGMLLSTARRYLNLCDVYQGSFGLAIISIQASDAVDQSQIFADRKYEGIAFKEAQVLVRDQYQLGGLDEASVMDKAQSLLISQPYMVSELLNIIVTWLIENLES